MKKRLFLIAFLFPAIVFSQDIIVKKNSETIVSKVIEITQSEIKYKPFKDSVSPLRSVTKNEVLLIYYQNGTREIFNNIGTSTTTQVKERNPQEYRNGLVIGDIVLFKGEETGKYRKGRLDGFTDTKAIIRCNFKTLEVDIDKVSKYSDQPKSQRKKDSE